MFIPIIVETANNTIHVVKLFPVHPSNFDLIRFVVTINILDERDM